MLLQIALFNSFLWLSSIPLYSFGQKVHLGFSVMSCGKTQMNFLANPVYHIFCIHSSVGGYLGCFYVLATVSSAAVDVGVHASF